MRSFCLASLFAALTASMPIDSPNQLSPRSIPSTDGVLIINVINKYRTAYNLPTLAWNDELAFDALAVGQQNGGVTENHFLFGDDLAQVIAPGPTNDIAGVNMKGFSPFEATYVGGWLCEVPSDPEISAICPQILPSILNYEVVETGHHDILVSTAYHNIGCWFTANPAVSTTSEFQGLWVCNLNWEGGWETRFEGLEKLQRD